MVNQICRMEPAPFISASVTEALAFTCTQSALPPVGSALEARREAASLKSASPSKGPFCCPKTKVERHTRIPTIRIKRVPPAKAVEPYHSLALLCLSPDTAQQGSARLKKKISVEV